MKEQTLSAVMQKRYSFAVGKHVRPPRYAGTPRKLFSGKRGRTGNDGCRRGRPQTGNTSVCPRRSTHREYNKRRTERRKMQIRHFLIELLRQVKDVPAGLRSLETWSLPRGKLDADKVCDGVFLKQTIRIDRANSSLAPSANAAEKLRGLPPKSS